MTCLCGARIARGYGGRLVHMTAPVGKPHYAIEAKPTARVAEHKASPRARSATQAAGLGDRFWSKVLKADEPSECWEWTSVHSRGYARYSIKSRWVPAHRLAYEEIVGPIPEGLELDHLCRNRGCLNPAHMEPVTPLENQMRGEGFAARNARKTACPKGHPYVHRIASAKVVRSCNACALERYHRVVRPRRLSLRAADTSASPKAVGRARARTPAA